MAKPSAYATRSWTEGELAYLAGLIDGEGHFNVRTRPNQEGRRYHDVKLSIANTDMRMLEWLREHFGSTIVLSRPQRGRNRALYTWNIHSAALEVVLPLTLPYLVTKRRQAELVLALRNTINLGTNRLTPETVAIRAQICAEMKMLTKRGV